MASAKSRDINMLEGPLMPKILRFVIPLMITNLLQTLYSAADMIVVGMSDVEGAIGSIGTTSAMLNLIVNVFMGFSVGANVVVARCIGCGDRGATERSVHTAILVGIISGLLGMGIGLAVCRPILILLGDEGHVLDLATLYSRIYFAGTPFIALTNYGIAIFRAKGDTQTPLFVLTAAGILNVLLNLFFVLVCGMSVDGVSLATVISNAVSAAALLFFLSRDTGWCRFEIKKLKISKKELRDIVRDGLPAGLQGAVFSLSNMLISSSIIRVNNTMCPGGSAVIDGNAAGGNLEGFCYTLSNSVYQAAVTFTSQHFGAGKHKRMNTVIRQCYLLSFLIAEGSGLLILLLRKTLIGLYVDAPMAVEVAELRCRIIMSGYFTLGAMEIGSGILRGLGRSVTSTLVSLLGCCALRVAWILIVFRAVPTLTIIYLSYPISWTVTALTHLVCWACVRRKYPKTDAPTPYAVTAKKA